jgi:hypothetical protein
MTWKLKGSLLAAAVISAAAVSQAQATFTYDLRFAPGTIGATDAHDVVVTAPGTYTLQLWGQLSGDSTLTNDGYIDGFVSVLSTQAGGGAFTSGGITGATLGTHASAAVLSATVGTSNGADANGDGIGDWGSTSTASASPYLKWGGGAPPAGYADGTTDAQSEMVNATTWEILLATYTVNVGTLSLATGGTTTFGVNYQSNVKTSLTSSLPQLDYVLDGSTTPVTTLNGQNNVVFSLAGGTITTPEPASLGLLALGGLALMNRRRKA